MKTGLVSVTFRQLDTDQIIDLVKQAQLDGIEWGGDIHVPVGDIQTALKVAEKMKENGLETLSYGSYYRAGENNDFENVLKTAAALSTQNVRIWAGSRGSSDADETYRDKVTADVRRIAALAGEYGITVSFEYHGGTLTDTQESTLQLLRGVDRDNVYTYWQPLANTTHTENIENIKELSKRGLLMNIHAYHWLGQEVFTLEEGASFWREYIRYANCRSVLLEFVKDNSIESFLRDAATLKELVK